MNEWSKKWLLKFHPRKCSVMRIGKKNTDRYQYTMDESLKQVRVEKDLGLIIDENLNFREHFTEKINKANRIVGLIIRTFVALDEKIFRSLFVALVRPHLEFANQVWSPYKRKNVDVIEGVQRRATKLVPGLKNRTYEERLRKLHLPTLAYRRSRGDMVETFKFVNGVYDKELCEGLFCMQEESGTRGHGKKIFKQRSRLDIRKYSFCNRVVNSWNNLPRFCSQCWIFSGI